MYVHKQYVHVILTLRTYVVTSVLDTYSFKPIQGHIYTLSMVWFTYVQVVWRSVHIAFKSYSKLPNFLSQTCTQQCPLSFPTIITSVFSQFIFISHSVNALSNFFKFICRDSSLPATSTTSSAKSRTSTISSPAWPHTYKPLSCFLHNSVQKHNSHGDSPWSTSNHSECLFPTLTLASHSTYRDCIALTVVV